MIKSLELKEKEIQLNQHFQNHLFEAKIKALNEIRFKIKSRTSIGRNSILQPNDISSPDGGGLYRRLFQIIEF